MNKKGDGSVFSTIQVAILVLIILVIVIIIIMNLFKGIWKDTCNLADSASLDSDKDGTANIADACDCDPDPKCTSSKDTSCFKDEPCKK